MGTNPNWCWVQVIPKTLNRLVVPAHMRLSMIKETTKHNWSAWCQCLYRKQTSDSLWPPRPETSLNNRTHVPSGDFQLLNCQSPVQMTNERSRKLMGSRPHPPIFQLNGWLVLKRNQLKNRALHWIGRHT